jgi:heme oxygenase (biliverdin-IX-beta and delta-forming)
MPDSDLGTARLLLRNATSRIHTRLDAALTFLDLRRQDDYAALLAAHAGALVPLECALREAGVDDVIPDWAERVRSDVLRADLADLGAQATSVMAPAFACEASVFGAAYVLEGSRLGSAAMLKSVGADFPTRYLRHGQGSRLWPRFLERLEQSSSVQQRPNAAVAGAIDAFNVFDRAFEATLSSEPVL